MIRCWNCRTLIMWPEVSAEGPTPAGGIRAGFVPGLQESKALEGKPLPPPSTVEVACPRCRFRYQITVEVLSGLAPLPENRRTDPNRADWDGQS